jgi:hypothetical protein
VSVCEEGVDGEEEEEDEGEGGPTRAHHGWRGQQWSTQGGPGPAGMPRVVGDEGSGRRKEKRSSGGRGGEQRRRRVDATRAQRWR